jgi:hypothetical protein
MTQKAQKLEFRDLLNKTYNGNFIFELTDDEQNIVGWKDDNTFKNIICVIEPTKSEFDKFIEHMESLGISGNLD